jgi:hypothetical protein
VVELPAVAEPARITTCDSQALESVYRDTPPGGFAVLILPASSPVHLDYALRAPFYPEFASRPMVGWVSGTALEDQGRVAPKVVDGSRRELHGDRAALMQLRLAAGWAADLEIVNGFEPGDGPVISFPVDGCEAGEVFVDGRRLMLADYLRSSQADTRLPLVADLFGTMINTSIKAVEGRRVQFYAPVFRGVEYRLARPVGDYGAAFAARVPAAGAEDAAFSCNCILNYLYAELEGKRSGPYTGPMTFGEIAYQLLNQTLVILRIARI